jgi:hypothetical protein
MVDMDEAAVAAEAAVEATKAVVEPGTTMAAGENRARIMTAMSEVSTRPRRVTELRHPKETREGTSLQR